MPCYCLRQHNCLHNSAQLYTWFCCWGSHLGSSLGLMMEKHTLEKNHIGPLLVFHAKHCLRQHIIQLPPYHTIPYISSMCSKMVAFHAATILSSNCLHNSSKQGNTCAHASCSMFIQQVLIHFAKSTFHIYVLFIRSDYFIYASTACNQATF